MSARYYAKRKERERAALNAPRPALPDPPKVEPLFVPFIIGDPNKPAFLRDRGTTTLEPPFYIPRKKSE